MHQISSQTHALGLMIALETLINCHALLVIIVID